METISSICPDEPPFEVKEVNWCQRILFPPSEKYLALVDSFEKLSDKSLVVNVTPIWNALKQQSEKT